MHLVVRAIRRKQRRVVVTSPPPTQSTEAHPVPSDDAYWRDGGGEA